MVISASDLVKIYPNGKKAVDGVSFSLQKGEIFGFLGPNGAGKTTVVKMLSAISSPTSGQCSVLGLSPQSNSAEIHRLSGVVTEHSQMYAHMTGLQNLIFYGSVFGLNKTDAQNRAVNLLERLELTDAQNRKLETYSTGMRQRLSLARAMMHSPQILFLDEPTSGLDPESIQKVNLMIKDLAENDGVSIFLCTHQLRYAQELCNSYGLISNGKMLALGDIEKLRSMVFTGLLVDIRADYFPKDMQASTIEDNHYQFKVQSEDETPHIIKRIVADGGNIYHVATSSMSLEDIYFSLFEKSKEGQAHE